MENRLVQIQNFTKFHLISRIFFVGPPLTHSCTHASIVPTPDKQGVILLGCYQNHDPIYELQTVNGHLEWKTWDRELQVQRDDTVAMLVPHDLVNCE